MMFRRIMREQKGFTLIEMMVVLAIISLIAIFAVPNVTRALQNSRIKSVESQARQIQNSFDQYYNDNNEYPALSPTTPLSVSGAYDYFFDPDSPQGALFQYASMPDDVAASLFVPSGYAVLAGGAVTVPEYEFVIEVKNVTVTEKFIHISAAGVTRNGAATFIENLASSQAYPIQ